MKMTNRARNNPCNGGNFDDFFKEQGIFAAVHATALKRTLTTQIAKAMRERNLMKSEIARRMRTSQVNPLMIEQIRRARSELAAICLRHNVRRLDLFGSAVGIYFDQTTGDLDFLVEFGPFPQGGYSDH